MSNEIENQMSELESLKLFCDNANISYHSSIGLEKLREKVQKFHDAQEELEIKAAVANAGKAADEVARNEALKLIRVRVVNMDPNKRDYEGDFVTTYNPLVGTVKRMVPYGVTWHIENILYQTMKEKVFRQSYDVPDGKGGKYRKNRFVPTYSIEVLPPLTKEELDQLAAAQLARNSITED